MVVMMVMYHVDDRLEARMKSGNQNKSRLPIGRQRQL